MQYAYLLAQKAQRWSTYSEMYRLRCQPTRRVQAHNVRVRTPKCTNFGASQQGVFPSKIPGPKRKLLTLTSSHAVCPIADAAAGRQARGLGVPRGRLVLRQVQSRRGHPGRARRGHRAGVQAGVLPQGTDPGGGEGETSGPRHGLVDFRCVERSPLVLQWPAANPYPRSGAIDVSCLPPFCALFDSLGCGPSKRVRRCCPPCAWHQVDGAFVSNRFDLVVSCGVDQSNRFGLVLSRVMCSRVGGFVESFVLSTNRTGGGGVLAGGCVVTP